MSKDKDLAERLRTLPRLSGLSDKELAQVAKAGTPVHLPANWSLMSETTPADKAYIVLSGQVEIRRNGETVATTGSGDVIGEVGVLESRLRTASVVSVTELEVVHFTTEALRRLVADIPALDQALRATADDHLADEPE